MPTNKLPTIDGGERELKDGDRVRLRNGIDDTIHWSTEDNAWRGLEGRDSGGWMRNGRRWNNVSDSPHDIVLILGPAEQDNGDGTVTHIRTLAVTGHPDDVVRTSTVSMEYPRIRPEQHHRNATLKLAAPRRSYKDKLVEAVKAGTVVLPPGAKRLKRCVGANQSWWEWVDGGTAVELWSDEHNGPLPPREPGDEDSVDLAEVREEAGK
ncbi:hypothetical protein [Botrimarina mediterranea]|uniref:hypothetical protein n=1 Tax=Botrimarina mediterranea TaxID=2528022 RepID=UPI00118C328F|nr:hypothetical protein K2D_16590 [Planctomycetes bacterium K2D]